MKSKTRMIITMKKPINGYWDGGPKKRFEFSIDREWKDKKGHVARVGSFGANAWANVGAGKTKRQSDKQILRNATKRLSKSFRNGIESIEFKGD